MRVMTRRGRHLLGTALFPPGVFAVHQLRYLLAFGSDAPHELANQGHGYLLELMPWIILAVALGFGSLLARLAHAWRGGVGDDDRGRRLVALWALASAGLLGMYVGQEFFEGLLATGHPQGIGGILGDGGLLSLPASIAVGGVLALVVRGSRELVSRIARRRRSRARNVVLRAPRRAVRPACVAVALPRLAPLAGASAGRAPPISAPR